MVSKQNVLFLIGALKTPQSSRNWGRILETLYIISWFDKSYVNRIQEYSKKNDRMKVGNNKQWFSWIRTYSCKMICTGIFWHTEPPSLWSTVKTHIAASLAAHPGFGWFLEHRIRKRPRKRNWHNNTCRSYRSCYWRYRRACNYCLYNNSPRFRQFDIKSYHTSISSAASQS